MAGAIWYSRHFCNLFDHQDYNENPMKTLIKPSLRATISRNDKKYRAVILGALFSLITAVFPMQSSAHGPTRQVVKQQITIQAPADEVWAVVGDFFALDKWHPAVLSSEKIDDQTRKLSLDEEGKVTLTEKIKKLEPEKMKLKYKIIDMAIIEEFKFSGIDVKRKALPVDTYSSILQVTAMGDSSKVTWIGKFYRGYMLNPPTPEGMDDASAIATITAVYNAGLENLAQQFDGDDAAKAMAFE